ncbi:ubiquitin-like domain-containing protein [Nocardia sp. CA-128927]|uniref:ubiquitin-like domain-containing protein n=1 Tax=Nocardia sp. CA-128927 TaxID=3239975 RepID=UPI003D980AC3
MIRKVVTIAAITGILIMPTIADVVAAPSGYVIDGRAGAPISNVALTIHGPSGASMVVKISPAATVGQLEQQIISQSQSAGGYFMSSTARLYLDNTRLQDLVELEDMSRTLSSYGVINGDQIFIFEQ